jgi:hypothetical protein
MLGSFWVAAQLAASQVGLSSMNEWIPDYIRGRSRVSFQLPSVSQIVFPTTVFSCTWFCIFLLLQITQNAVCYLSLYGRHIVRGINSRIENNGGHLQNAVWTLVCVLCLPRCEIRMVLSGLFCIWVRELLLCPVSFHRGRNSQPDVPPNHLQ